MKTKAGGAVRRSTTKKKRTVITMKEAIRTAEIGKMMYVRTGPTVSRIRIERALAPNEVYDYVCAMLAEMDRGGAMRDLSRGHGGALATELPRRDQ